MRPIITTRGEIYSPPLLLPVFEYGNPFITVERLKREFSVAGLMTNAYFLYKRRDLKPLVLEQGIKEFLGFGGLVITDSGAFQQLSGPLYLSNSKIISFQQSIGADIISPLDVITTPGDDRTTAKKKLQATMKRIKEGISVADRAVLIGVQQGGRFLDLRAQALEELMELGTRYIALGSLVPFFNRNHDIEFVGKVIRQARELVSPDIPLHLYGGGDPLELPFYIALGCDVFDSSSFIHYARDGWYMTPYGALKGQEKLESVRYTCSCPYCQSTGRRIWQDVRTLTAHNLWVILDVVQKTGRMARDGTLLDHLGHVINTHQQWFPESRLARSWETLCR